MKTPNVQGASRPAGAGGYRLVAFPKEFERNMWESIDRRFYTILMASLALIYGLVIYLANHEYPQDLIDKEIKRKYIQKFYAAEFEEPVQDTTEEMGAGLGDEEKPEEKVDERAKRDEGKRAEATGTSASERRNMRREAAARRGAQRAAMEQAVAGSGILAELSAGGGGGSGDAVYDVLGAGGGGGVGDLEQVLGSVGGLQTASSGASRSVLGARSSGGNRSGGAGIDDLVQSGVGQSGSVSIKRQGSFAIKMEEGTVSGRGSKSANRSADAISRIIAKHADAIENCYKKESRINPNLKGSITVQFSIQADGRVENVRIIDSTIRNKNVENCVISRIRRWRFDKIDESEGDVSFRQKYIFSS